MPDSQLSSSAYAQAGVDIAKADRLLAQVKPAICKASRPEVLGSVGGFGGFFDISRLRLNKPVLVSSTDSVGTKVSAARICRNYRFLGADIVNHCANDIAVCGAEPLYFLDYYATGVLEDNYVPLIKGLAGACRKANIALIGGETAELPGVYQQGECDLVGSIVGVVDKDRILTGRSVRPGDHLLGLASSGLHTNGFSLARRILFDHLHLAPEDPLPGFRLKTATALLKPHLNYSGFLHKALATCNSAKRAETRRGNAIFAAAHITGGGFPGNLPRVLPENCAAVVDTTAWKPLPVFQSLLQSGQVDFHEAYEVFNMGIGMVLVVRPDQTDAISQLAKDFGHKAFPVGEVTRGHHEIRLLS